MNTADFTVANPQNLATSSEGLVLQLTAPASGLQQDPGTGTRISSTSYMLYGRFSARVKAGAPGGMVTSFISMSDSKDEIDWEIVGGNDNNIGQSNFFLKGVVDYSNSGKHNLPGLASAQFNDFTVDWNKDRIQWILNGKVVRTVYSNNSTNYPNTPSRIQFAVWDGGNGAEGTRNWAGGYIPWTQSAYTATFSSITIQCPGDTAPTTTPARVSGYIKPTLQDREIKVAVPGLSGYLGSENGGNPNEIPRSGSEKGTGISLSNAQFATASVALVILSIISLI